jgi:hypothetical protein
MTNANRIETRFSHIRNEGRSALVTFIMAGDPDRATSESILKQLPPQEPTSSKSACRSRTRWPTGRSFSWQVSGHWVMA